MAISEDRSLFGWPQGCPAAIGASSASGVLPNVTLVLIHWALPVLEASCWSIYLCVWSWVCIVELKIQCTSSNFFKTLLIFASERVSKGPRTLAPSVPQPAGGKEWDGSSGNMRRWKCRNLQCRIGLRGWEEAGEGCTEVVQKVRWPRCSSVPSCNSRKPQGLPL